MTTNLTLTFFGAPHIALAQQSLDKKISGKARALFIYLAVTGRSHTRDGLADLLWSDLSTQQGRNNLRYLLPDLRKVVGDFLIITPQSISFNRQQPYWLDVEVLRTTLTAQPQMVSTQALQAALDLYQDKLLTGFTVRNAPVFEAWVTQQREELHTLVVNGFYTLAQRYQAQGAYQAGLATTQRLLQWEPWHEAGHRLQMQLLADSGQRAAALAHYSLCRHTLAEELDVEPEAATTALYEQLRRGEDDKETGRQGDKETGRQEVQTSSPPLPFSPSPPLPFSPSPPLPFSPSPPLPFSPPLPHNLPGQLTPFIGREAEIGRLCTLLADPDHRLITLTGLGGIGKTRLALAVGQRILDFGFEILDFESVSSPNNQKSRPEGSRQNPKFPDGVWFVPLIGLVASENLTDTLAVAMADALHLPRSGPIAPAEELLDYLRGRSLLLILDNFEHLMAGTDFLLTLLQRSTTLKLLVTSRHLLNLHAEFVWSLDGLAVPGPDEAVTITTSKVQTYDSVALFVERAQRANRAFRPDQANQAEILHICRFVEGLPLGIELAAAMTRHFSCHQLWQTLQQDYRALATTQRDLAPRHRTITAMLDYSWRLLTPTQARVLAACTLFPQAFTLEAATAVANATPEILFTLVDQSLLKQTATGHFEFHELVRYYAAEQLHLDPQAEALCRQRHVDYFSTLIEADIDELMRVPAKLHLVQQELPNLQMVWRRCVEQQQLLPIMRLSQGIFLHYMAQGPLPEGWDLCNAVIEGLRRRPTAHMNADESRFFALALAALAYLGYYLGRHAEVTQLVQEALALAQPLADARSQAMAYGILGMVAFAQGNTEDHENLCRTALAYARAEPIPHMIVANLAFLGLGLAVQSKLNEALAALHEALHLVHEQQLVYLEGYILSELGFVYAMTGDWALADGTTQQALHLNQGLNNNLNRGYQYARLALFAEAVGAYPRAIAWTDQALAFSTLVPDPLNQLSVLLIRGRAMRYLGDLQSAEIVLQQVLPLAQKLSRHTERAQAQIELGHVTRQRQAWQTAEAHYRTALEIATAADLPIVAAAQTGLAQLCFQRNLVVEALSWVEHSLAILFTQPLETQYDAVNATLTCYQVLTAAQDPRAISILQQATAWVEAQSLKISEESLRRSFLENVPHHRQLLALAGVS